MNHHSQFNALFSYDDDETEPELDESKLDQLMETTQ